MKNQKKNKGSNKAPQMIDETKKMTIEPEKKSDKRSK
jgi:hypothetical protein